MVDDDEIEHLLETVIWGRFLELLEQWNIEAYQLHVDRLDLYFREQERKLPQPFLVAIRYYEFQFELDNGGYEQYFYNIVPLVITETLALFHETGLHDSAALLSEAMGYYEEVYDWPRTSNERWLVWTDNNKDDVPRKLPRTFDPRADRQRLYQYLTEHGYQVKHDQ